MSGGRGERFDGGDRFIGSGAESLLRIAAIVLPETSNGRREKSRRREQSMPGDIRRSSVPARRENERLLNYNAPLDTIGVP